MWQRIQTLYAAIAVFITLVLLFVSVGSIQLNDSVLSVKGLGVSGGEEMSGVPGTIAYLVIIVVGVLVGGISVVLFNNRKLQAKILLFSIVFQLGTIAVGYFTLTQISNFVVGLGQPAEVSYGIGLILPLVSIILLFLARKAVMKDDELVKSVDRLR